MQPLLVTIPNARVPEHRWIVTTLLSTYLGISVELREHDQQTIQITDGQSDRCLILPSILIDSDDEWSAAAIPTSVPLWISPSQFGFTTPQSETSTPILYVDSRFDVPEIDSSRIALPWDLFGSSFFMLTRLEEIHVNETDKHDRFPASATISVREGFERMPVVNAWAEILWSALKQLWPSLERKPRSYEVKLSHDVDWPLAAHGVRLLPLIKAGVGDVVTRKSLTTAARRILGKYGPQSKRTKIDPGNTFDFIMNVSERRGLSSAFYFIPENTAGEIDGTYSFDMPFIRDLLSEIHQRGHEIGIHPGYETYRSADRIRSGFERLRTATESLGIHQESWGGRQHFLRWHAPETWCHWEAAGLNYDSTVGFADTVGFRTGACFEYNVFDVVGRRALALVERPLVVMEVSLFQATSGNYLALDNEEGIDVISKLADVTRAYSGDFTLLWHNSSLLTDTQKHLYQDVVDSLASR